MSKRVLSLFMALVLSVSLLPAPGFAESENIPKASDEAITEVDKTDAEEENTTKETDTQPTEENNLGTNPEPSSQTLDETVSLAAALEPIEYIDKNGNKATCEDYIPLTGDPAENKLDGTESEAWYVLTGQFNATADWVVDGNVNIILTDGSSCNTNGHYIDLKDKAELAIYSQENGTGLLSIYHSPADGAKEAALGGPSQLIEDDNMHWHTELGSFALYGGNVNIESTGYYAADLAGLTVMGGTLTAKTVESYNTIFLHSNKPTLAENYKICKADDPQEKATHGNTAGIKVLITECTKHIRVYYSSETKGMHKVVCGLCSVSREEAHDFSLNGSMYDDMRHYLKCACGALSESTSYHELVYIPNYDTLTHRYACKVCDYERGDGNEEHDFTQNQALCADCGFKRGASVKIGDTLKNYGKFEDAIDAVSGVAGSNTGGTVTLYGKEDCFDGKQINVKWGKFTVDFNGADLTLPGISLFNIPQTAEVTLKNGKINLAGDIPYRNVPGIIDRSGGLTLENLVITSSCCTSDGHIQHPAVKVMYNNAAKRTFTAKNVVFNGGFESENGTDITPFTSGSFVYSCESAKGNYPIIKVGKRQSIAGIIADGYALAEYDDNTKLVPMYDYDDNGFRVDITEIRDSVTVVPHPQHTFDEGYCGCGYKCYHEGGLNADGMCPICGAHAVASVGGEKFTEFSTAFAKANELAKTEDNVTVNILYDLESLYDTGYATGKITLDLNGHDLSSCDVFSGKKDENGNVTAEGDLTIIDSSESKSGEIGRAKLLGGKLTVGNINVRSIEINDGEANVSGGKPLYITVQGGKANISGGEMYQVTAKGGETHIYGGLTESLRMNGGKIYVSGGTVNDFKMGSGGEIYISDGYFKKVSVDIFDSDDTNPKLEITGGTFDDAVFTAKTKGRIAISGGIFKKIFVGALTESNVRTVGDLLADGYMFHSTDDNSIILGDTNTLIASAEVKRHTHSYIEKAGADGKYYGECACGNKAEAVIEKSDAKIYYDTFEKAAAELDAGDILKLCFDAECDDDVTINGKGNYKNRIKLNLDGHSLNFAEGNKLNLLYSYIDIIDNESESGYISHIYVNWSTTQLYGGTYGRIDAETNMIKGIRGNGCGYKKTDGSGWVTNLDVLSLTDVAVKQAPYTVEAIVTNTPDGTETPEVIYPGQKLYFKLIFRTYSYLDPISESNPATCSVDYIRADGKSRVVGTNVSVTGNDAFISEILPEDAPAGNYRAKFEYIEFYGCTQEIDIPFTVEVCNHDSYTNGYCNTCGFQCKHTDVSESGVCDVCKTEFSAMLTTADGTVSYYTDVPVAIANAALAENKGSTVKLFKTFNEENELYLTATAEARGEFTIDLNGYYFGTINSKIYLSYIDLTIMTSVSREAYTVFYTEIRPELYSTVTCPEVEVDTKLDIYRLSFRSAPNAGIGTNSASLGSGVYLEWFDDYGNGNKMKYDEILAPGCIFKDGRSGNIYPRSEEIPNIVTMTVIKCPHSEWEDNKCKYCGLICDHPNGFVDGICPDCGRACEHPHLDEKFVCTDCHRQMAAKIETKDGVVTYDTDFSAAINEAESDATVTLLTDTTFMNNVYVCGEGRNITLNLNGFEASSNRGVFNIGGTGVSDVGKGGTLKIVGDGKLMVTVNVYKSAALDLSERTGGEIKSVTVYPDSVFTGSTPTEAYIGAFTLSSYNTEESLEKAKEINLNGGSYGEIFWQTYGSHDLTLGFLLAPGYAFQKDGSFVPYATKLSHDFSAPKYIQNVIVVKCEEHSDSDENGKCDYCNSELAASVVGENDTVYNYYTDINEAVNAQLELGNSYTVKLLSDREDVLWLAKGSPKIDLNNHTVSTIWLTDTCKANILGSGTVKSLSVGGKYAGLAAAAPVFDQIVISAEATWSSILPDDSFGYKVYGSGETYNWYDIDTVEAFANGNSIISNVSIQPLPIGENPILMLGNEQLEDGSVVNTDEDLRFSVKLKTPDADCMIHYKRFGSSSQSNLETEYKSDRYESLFAPRFVAADNYEVWAEVTKDGYKRTTGKYTIKAKKNLADATITLEHNEFTYEYPGVTHTAKIASVTLSGETIPEDVYTVDGDTSGTDAKTYTLRITAKEDSNYIGSANVNWEILPCKLAFRLVCSPKVYDGNKNGDPNNINSIEFFDADDENVKVALTENDYTIESIEYDSENVGGNYGDEAVNATADVKLKGSAANNCILVDGTAYGCITPAPIDNIADYHSYTYKVCYNDIYAKTVTASYFGAPNRTDYIIVSDMIANGNADIFSKMSLENEGFLFAVANGLGINDVGKSCTVKFRIYSKNHNYCTGELSFTVEIADKGKPKLTVEPITAVYNGKDVSVESIDGTATIDGHKINGTWSFTENKSRKNVKDSGIFNVEFTPSQELLDYYYTADTDVSVTITPRDIGDEDVTFRHGSSYAYTGETITPAVSAEYDGGSLAEGVNEDYTVTYPTDAISVGEKKITVIGHGNFGGTKELVYAVTPCTKTPTIELSQTEYTYDENEKKPTVTVVVDGRKLVEGRDFDVTYSNNVNAEAGAKVTVTSKGNYGFAKQEKYFRIVKADSVIETEPAANNLTYDSLSHRLVTAGKVKGGTFEYKLGDGEWTKDIPLKKDAAEYTVWYRVAGDSNHNDIGEKSITVTIEQRDISDAKVILFGSLVYNGNEQEQKIFGVRLSETFDVKTYDVTNNRATDAGTYKLTVTGTGNFKGTCDAEFTIARKEVTANVTVGGTYIYNGKDIEPSDITVKDGEDVIPDTEYTKGFENNKDAGTAKVTITNAEGGNYIVNGTGEFGIEKANITVKPKNISKIYGSEPEFKFESESDLITPEELEVFADSAEFTSDGAAKTAKASAQGYEIAAVLTENETKNLILTVSGTGTLTVVPAKLKIKVNDVSRIYGEPNPELSVSYDGFVNGEDENILNGSLMLSYSDSINETTAVGTHEGMTTASGLTSENYDIEYLNGNVTITKIPVSTSAGAARKSYLDIVFDKSMEGLAAANFIVKDNNGNTVNVTNTTVSSDGKTYTLSGIFEVGKEYTVKVVLSGTAAEATHQLTNDELVITPIRTSNDGGGSSGTSRYTVSFNTNGGSDVSNQTVTKNSVIKEPTAPTKDGFDFAGWYADKELKEKYDFSAKVTKSITLYAAWAEKDNSDNRIVLTIGEKDALVFGITKTNDVAPKIVNDRTMLPARFVAENLGAEVSWDGEKELVTIKGKNLKTSEDITILIYIGSDIAYVNGKEIRLDSPAFIENDRTYTPIRFISEELGTSVEWIEKEQKVVITK